MAVVASTSSGFTGLDRHDAIPTRLTTHQVDGSADRVQDAPNHLGGLAWAPQFAHYLARATARWADGQAGRTDYTRWMDDPYVLARICQRVGESLVLAVLAYADCQAFYAGEGYPPDGERWTAAEWDAWEAERAAALAETAARCFLSEDALIQVWRRIEWAARNDYGLRLPDPMRHDN